MTVLKLPICDLGLSPGNVRKLHWPDGAGDWWGREFQIGRAQFDAKYCAVWRAFFQSCAPAERDLAPVFRFLVRSRGAKLRGEEVPDLGSLYKVVFDTVSNAMDLGVTPAELGSVLRAYVEDPAADVVKTISAQDNLVGENEGQLEPRGVIGGMVFAMATRASYISRLKWFESLDWDKMSCMLRGPLPASSADKRSTRRSSWIR